MNEKEQCDKCHAEKCIKIKPINETVCIDIWDFKSASARAYNKETDKRRPDGSTIRLKGGRTFETTTTAKGIYKLLVKKSDELENSPEDVEPCLVCGKRTCVRINVVYRSVCINPDDILAVTPRPYDKEKQKRRLDGCRIIFKNATTMTTSMTMKSIEKFIKELRKC